MSKSAEVEKVFICVIKSYGVIQEMQPCKTRESAEKYFSTETGYAWSYFQVLLTAKEPLLREEQEFVDDYEQSYIREVEVI